MDKFWMIANVTACDDFIDNGKLHPGHEPKYMHYTKEDAETELLRLEQEHPADEFVLLEAVAEVRENLGGLHYVEYL